MDMRLQFFNVFVLLFFSFKNITAEGFVTDIADVNRTGKQFFYPFFGVGVVRFQNGICSSASGLQGTCYTRRECAGVDGIGSTSCAKSIGICCVIQRTCGQSSQVNNTYFVSPGFPSAYKDASACSFTIKKINSDVCQVRIDFLTLRLAQPNVNGTCISDALVVTGGASNIPVICGDNTGSHMYVDFNGNSNIVITVSTSGSSSTSTAWNIRITQINCNCDFKAPAGCLQFYNTASGTVISFNYGASGFQTGSRQLANQNYGVCIGMLPGYCSIQWTPSSGSYSFTVSGNTNSKVSDGTIGTINAELFGTDCEKDFVIIPAPTFSNGTASNTDRFCGNGFATVTSSSKPFQLSVVTDADELTDVGNRGFSLAFTQLRCTGSIFIG